MGFIGYDNPVVNVKGTPGIISDVAANRTYGYQGLIYIESDTQLIYQYNNGAWQLIGGGGSTGAVTAIEFTPTPGSSDYPDAALIGRQVILFALSGVVQEPSTWSKPILSNVLSLLNGQTFQPGQLGLILYQ